jgi:hypothetical protein
MHAECPYENWHHSPPESSCSCGIYAQYDLPALHAATFKASWIWGAVSMWGKVLLHSYEVRAERARIELFAYHAPVGPLEGAEGLLTGDAHGEVSHLAARLGLRLTRFDRLRELSHSIGRPPARAMSPEADRRPRRGFLHLSYSCAPSYSDRTALVTHDPEWTRSPPLSSVSKWPIP